MPKPLKNIKPLQLSEVGNIDVHHYFGTVLRGVKGFIMRREFSFGKFAVHCTDAFTMGNSYDSYDRDTIKEVVTALITDQFEVYEFTNRTQFFTWLSKP